MALTYPMPACPIAGRVVAAIEGRDNCFIRVARAKRVFELARVFSTLASLRLSQCHPTYLWVAPIAAIGAIENRKRFSEKCRPLAPNGAPIAAIGATPPLSLPGHTCIAIVS